MEATEEGAGASATTTCGICVEEFPEEGVVKYCDGKHVFCKGCFDGWIKKSLDELNERNVFEKITDLVEHYCHEKDDNVCMIPEFIYTGIKCPVCREMIHMAPLQDGIPLNYTGPFSKEITPNPGNSGNIMRAGTMDVGKVECHYLNGKKHGPFKSYNSNGEVKIECEFVNGRLEGSYIYWGKYMVHKIYEITYVNGVMNGPKKYYDGATLSREQIYQDGLLCEQKKYELTGEIGSIRTYDQGTLIREKGWHPNRNLEFDIGFSGEGFKHGECKIWHDNGLISNIEHWRNGVKYGIHQWFDEEGKLIEEKDYGEGSEMWFDNMPVVDYLSFGNMTIVENLS
jgi:antitoxin component YwqK of YwqJK toxin-antitoxin module